MFLKATQNELNIISEETTHAQLETDRSINHTTDLFHPQAEISGLRQPTRKNPPNHFLCFVLPYFSSRSDKFSISPGSCLFSFSLTHELGLNRDRCRPPPESAAGRLSSFDTSRNSSWVLGVTQFTKRALPILTRSTRTSAVSKPSSQSCI